MSGPASPTAEERREKIAAANEVIMRKRRQSQELDDRKKKLTLQAKKKEKEALDERSRVMDRSERQLMIKQRQLDHADAVVHALDREEREKEENRLQRWAEIKAVGEELSEISVSWEDLPTLPDILFDDNPASAEIASLNLVGLGLEQLSDRVGQTFTSLRALKLDSNKVRCIPNNICQLPELREISAVRNQIEKLPFNIGLLCNLRRLLLPSNCLKRLPATMKLLTNLQVLNLEANQLNEIPVLGDLPLKRVNLNNNNLRSLMTLFQVSNKQGNFRMSKTLTVLSCNRNKLTGLPSKINNASELKELYLANNELESLPTTLGGCKQMEKFWVDWNPLLKEIPVSIANWQFLTELKAEGCPIAKPPPEMIFRIGGCQKRDCRKLVEWCSRHNTQTETNNHRQVITDLQRSLASIGTHGEIYNQLCDIFQPEVQALPKNPAKIAIMTDPDYDDGGIPLFYTFVLDALFEKILPLLQPNYAALTLIPGAQEALSEDFFLHSKEELVAAITEYDDAYGPVGALYKYAEYTKCSCKDDRGRRRVCIPPSPGKMCKRKPSVWLRMQLTTPEQYRFQQLRRNEIKTLASAIKDCKEKCIAFIASRWGKRLMRRRARVLAKESRAQKAVDAGANRRKQKQKKKDKKNETSLKKNIDRLTQKNKNYRKTLGKEQKSMLEERDQVFGQAKQELEERLAIIDNLLEKDNCLENSDGEEFDDLNVEWSELSDVKEEKMLEEDIGDLEELDSDEEEEKEQMLRFNRMTWRELLRASRIVAENEYIEEQCGIVRENIQNQFLLLQRVMKSWLSQAVKACYIAWRDWASVTAKSRKDAAAANEKAIELEQGAAQAKEVLEQMEALKWVEKFDDFY